MTGMPHPRVLDTARVRLTPLAEEGGGEGKPSALGVWTASDRESGDRVGACRVSHRAGDENFYAVECHVDRAHRGRGLGKEMSRAWLGYAMEWLDPLPVRVLVKENDIASVATAHACGMEQVGSRVLTSNLPDEPPSLIFQGPQAEVVSKPFDAVTRDAVLDLWVATTEAGGAVGFIRGDSRDRHDEALVQHEEQMRAGRAIAVLLRSPDDVVVGMGFWVQNPNPLLAHTRWAYRVMTDPARRGRNLGRLLLAAMHRAAREQGVEIAILGVRGGTGTEDFYATCGYLEAGRIPGAIRVAPGDDRDDITMYRSL